MRASAATASPAQLLSWEEFAALDDSEPMRGVELVDGLLEEGEVTTRKHGRIVIRLGSLLLAWLDANGGGDVLTQENRVRIAKRRVRKPDVLLVKRADRPVFEADTLVTAPHLLVEILSATRQDRLRDEVIKRADYESIGARHYWIIDPARDSMAAHTLGEDRLYGAPRAFGPDQLVRGEVFGLDGLRFRVRDLGGEPPAGRSRVSKAR